MQCVGWMCRRMVRALPTAMWQQHDKTDALLLPLMNLFDILDTLGLLTLAAERSSASSYFNLVMKRHIGPSSASISIRHDHLHFSACVSEPASSNFYRAFPGCCAPGGSNGGRTGTFRRPISAASRVASTFSLVSRKKRRHSRKRDRSLRGGAISHAIGAGALRTMKQLASLLQRVSKQKLNHN
eukprot:GHVT01081137.1.p1 GENE.GHVT01081137.1~~GHVT01081137.1.p1  ORF type:complete len:184 (-),score=18.82 GHVT01081137.1:1669-2220(-)